MDEEILKKAVMRARELGDINALKVLPHVRGVIDEHLDWYTHQCRKWREDAAEHEKYGADFHDRHPVNDYEHLIGLWEEFPNLANFVAEEPLRQEAIQVCAEWQHGDKIRKLRMAIAAKMEEIEELKSRLAKL